jgi:hypothetical protein
MAAAASSSATTNVQYVALPVESEQSDVSMLVQSEVSQTTKAARDWALGVFFIILVTKHLCLQLHQNTHSSLFCSPRFFN